MTVDSIAANFAGCELDEGVVPGAMSCIVDVINR
jgi:hypothetical protein